jgi:hypothetical protein
MKRSGFVLLLGVVAACSDDSGGKGEGQPVACGTSTCSGSEVCIRHQAPPEPFPGGTPQAAHCAPLPPGCNASSLCDCPGADGDWQGQAIVGCSVLGERSLYVMDVTCGARRCTAQEVCVARSSELACAPLPEGCRVELHFCDTECPDAVARAAGADGSMGCLGSDWGVAVLL